MRWLLAAVPVLLGGGGITLMSFAPEFEPIEGRASGEASTLTSVLSATVTCPGEIAWPDVLLAEQGDGESTGNETPRGLTVASGTLVSLEESVTGLTMVIADADGVPTEANLVNPACVPPGASGFSSLVAAAWTSWTRPCDSCDWTARIGVPLTVGLVSATVGEQGIQPVVALIFEGCAEKTPSIDQGSPSPTLTPETSPSPPTESPTPTATSTLPNPPVSTAVAEATATEPCDTPMTPEPSPSGTATSTVPAATVTTNDPAPTSPPPIAEVSVVSYTAQVARGDDAAITIDGPAGASCEIRYKTPSGTTSKASGLSAKSIPSDRQVTWRWGVSSRTSPGTGSITVTCAGSVVSLPIEIV